LGKLIYTRKEHLINSWSEAVRREIPEARHLGKPIIINSVPGFLDDLAEAVSSNNERQNATEGSNIPQEHGEERARLTTYKPQQLVREYQLLRRVLFKELSEEIEMTKEEKRVITESLDDCVFLSVTRFAEVQTMIREQFIATITHDLRNPLGVARLAVEAISWNPKATDVPEFIAKALENLNRVNAMIQDLLDATFLKAGGQLELEHTEFDMKEVLDAIIHRMSIDFGPRFRVDADSVRGYWDRKKVERSIENLISNAVKFGREGTDVTITLLAHHDRVNLSVHNYGDSIPNEEQELIFEAFRRGGGNGKDDVKKTGWGLGLALVKGVAVAHGGSVGLESLPERGTTFKLDMPLDTRPYKDCPQNF
jgi:signal transduction histidine kinase